MTLKALPFGPYHLGYLYPVGLIIWAQSLARPRNPVLTELGKNFTLLIFSSLLILFIDCFYKINCKEYNYYKIKLSIHSKLSYYITKYILHNLKGNCKPSW